MDEPIEAGDLFRSVGELRGSARNRQLLYPQMKRRNCPDPNPARGSTRGCKAIPVPAPDHLRHLRHLRIKPPS